jgi:hypothetical protein
MKAELNAFWRGNRFRNRSLTFAQISRILNQNHGLENKGLFWFIIPVHNVRYEIRLCAGIAGGQERER